MNDRVALAIVTTDGRTIDALRTRLADLDGTDPPASAARAGAQRRLDRQHRHRERGASARHPHVARSPRRRGRRTGGVADAGRRTLPAHLPRLRRPLLLGSSRVPRGVVRHAGISVRGDRRRLAARRVSVPRDLPRRRTGRRGCSRPSRSWTSWYHYRFAAGRLPPIGDEAVRRRRADRRGRGRRGRRTPRDPATISTGLAFVSEFKNDRRRSSRGRPSRSRYGHLLVGGQARTRPWRNRSWRSTRPRCLRPSRRGDEQLHPRSIALKAASPIESVVVPRPGRSTTAPSSKACSGWSRIQIRRPSRGSRSPPPSQSRFWSSMWTVSWTRRRRAQMGIALSIHLSGWLSSRHGPGRQQRTGRSRPSKRVSGLERHPHDSAASRMGTTRDGWCSTTWISRPVADPACPGRTVRRTSIAASRRPRRCSRSDTRSADRRTGRRLLQRNARGSERVPSAPRPSPVSPVRCGRRQSQGPARARWPSPNRLRAISMLERCLEDFPMEPRTAMLAELRGPAGGS